VFKRFRKWFGQSSPAISSEQILEDAIIILKNRRSKTFQDNQQNIISAFQEIAKQSPRKAFRLLFEIEKECHPENGESIFSNALSQIKNILATCTPSQKQDIYKTILGCPQKTDLAQFILDQAQDIAELLKDEIGLNLAPRILDKSTPLTKEILERFQIQFAKLITDKHTSPSADPLFLTKKLYAIHSGLGLPLPNYLAKVRSEWIKKELSAIVRENSKETPSFKKIEDYLRIAMSFGYQESDQIQQYKPTSGFLGITLIQLRLKNSYYLHQENKNLYFVCKSSGANNDKLSLILVDDELNDLIKCLSMMGRPKSEINALKSIFEQNNLSPIDQQKHFFITSTPSSSELPLTLHPAFKKAAGLTGFPIQLDSPYVHAPAFSAQFANWYLLPVQQCEPRAV